MSDQRPPADPTPGDPTSDDPRAEDVGRDDPASSPTAAPAGRAGMGQALRSVITGPSRVNLVPELLTTLFALVFAAVIGAILMIVSDADVLATFAYFFARPSDAIVASVAKVGGAYSALFAGSLGGIGPITETTAQAAPLICAGLGVALAFRAGLFNIGAQGQAIWGAVFAAWVGFSLPLPYVLQCTVAVVAGILGGAIWGGIVGLLKARFGAHEVIVTIMMNYIAAGMLAWLLTTPAFQRPGRTDPISPVVDWNATFARVEGTRLHVGFLLALLAAFVVYLIIERTSVGFEIRAVGANPHAAATAGMSVARTTIVTMALAGAFAGLAGTQSALGPSITGYPDPLSLGLVGTVGFDAITVALLGRSRPVGVILAGLLFGALRAGGLNMEAVSQTPATLTAVLQALIVLFVAAPALVRAVLPFIRPRDLQPVAPTTGALS